ncbi:MAG: hypothetical protein WBZ36_04435 [Candidatus Nitrosopolaris sp.]|jgi:hypothetical protein
MSDDKLDMFVLGNSIEYTLFPIIVPILLNHSNALELGFLLKLPASKNPG